MISAIKGYPLIITLPERMSTEKSDVMKALGTKIVRTQGGVEITDEKSHIGVAYNLK